MIIMDNERAFDAGQADDDRCEFCNDEKGCSDHIWRPKALEGHRQDADTQIEAINPKWIPGPAKHGVAPAMVPDPTRPFEGEGALGWTMQQRGYWYAAMKDK